MSNIIKIINIIILIILIFELIYNEYIINIVFSKYTLNNGESINSETTKLCC